MDDTGTPTVLILGGRSEIGIELAVRLAPGASIVLAARNADRLDEQIAAVRAAGAAQVACVEFDADDVESHGPLIDSIIAEYGPIDTAVLAFGILGDQNRAETDAAHAVAVVHTDYVAQVSLLTHLAAAMRQAGRGALVVFSSVAGIRVRRANYVYGSAKAGLDGFASGLADALHGDRSTTVAGAARFRDRADDRGHDAGPAVQHPGAGGHRDGAGAGQGPTDRVDSLGAAAGVLRFPAASAVRLAPDAAMNVAVPHCRGRAAT